MVTIFLLSACYYEGCLVKKYTCDSRNNVAVFLYVLNDARI